MAPQHSCLRFALAASGERTLSPYLNIIAGQQIRLRVQLDVFKHVLAFSHSIVAGSNQFKESVGPLLAHLPDPRPLKQPNMSPRR
jgi:hypothetical protein